MHEFAPPSPSSTEVAERYDPRDWVTPEDLNVAPELLGAPLASPKRRLFAMAVDLGIVAALSNIGNMWLVIGFGLLVLMHVRKPMADSRGRKLAVWALAGALIAFGAWQAAVSPHEPHKHRHKTDIEEASSDATSIPGLTPEKRAEVRIALLEAELAQARAPKTFDPKEQLEHWADDVGLGLSWAIAYFTLLPVWWRGQTVGKKLFGLRVVELTGKPLTVLRTFKRYGGYAAGMATGLMGFAQVFWDPNRQAIQDKTAHTVVIDLRRKLQPPPAEPSVPTTANTEESR